VSKLLLHPGWLVGTEVKHGEINILKELEPEMVEQQLADNGPALHSLRKTKRVRYQMEVFSDFYSEILQGLSSRCESRPRNFGSDARQFRFSRVLTDVLQSKINLLPWLNNWRRQVTNLAAVATLQQQYLNLETRKKLS